jgi:hypothetical protein
LFVSSSDGDCWVLLLLLLLGESFSVKREFFTLTYNLSIDRQLWWYQYHYPLILMALVLCDPDPADDPIDFDERGV